MSIGKKKSNNIDAGGPFRLLCIGDIHLGKRPTRIPENIEEFGVSKASLTPVAAWNNAVDWAIELHVDAVVLAGDVVEGLDDRFEAYAHLETGVRKLDRANIKVVGVAGNHDVEALPRLANQIEKFKLLGQGGKWEKIELTAKSGVQICLLGWSFPEQRVSKNPLDDFTGNIDGDIPTIGVLHCDVDGGTSNYAPVPKSAFKRIPTLAWLLGHIHKPDKLSGDRPVGYLGCLVAMDPGEPGLHGPWLAEITKSGGVELTQALLAPLRYERVDLDIESIPNLSGEDLKDELSIALRNALDFVRDRIDSTLGETRAVGCRIKLVGRSECHEGVRRILGDGSVDISPVLEDEGVIYFVEKIVDESAPTLNLAEIARGSDPPALLAKRLIDLQANALDAQNMVADASKNLEKISNTLLGSNATNDLSLESSDVSALLVRAGYAALEDLLAQRKSSDGDSG